MYLSTANISYTFKFSLYVIKKLYFSYYNKITKTVGHFKIQIMIMFSRGNVSSTLYRAYEKIQLLLHGVNCIA